MVKSGKMFVFHLKVSLIKYIRKKKLFRWSAGKRFIKVACLHVIFISQHFDWVLLLNDTHKERTGVAG